MLKIGVLGTGGIALRKMIPAIMAGDSARITALCDVSEAALAAAEKLAATGACHTDMDAFLREDMDAVYIATPVCMHREQAVAAALSGRHVLCEKPAAMSPLEYDEMLSAAGRSGVLLKTAYVMRMHPLHALMRGIIKGGGIGRVVSVDIAFSCDYPPAPGAWRQRREYAGGGSLMDMGVHAIDLAYYLHGDAPERVLCSARNLEYDYEVEDACNLAWTSAGGAFATVSSHYCVPDDIAESRIFIQGTKGALEARGTLSQSCTGSAWLRKPGTAEALLEYERVDTYGMLVREFARQALSHGHDESDRFAVDMVAKAYANK